MQQFKQIRVIFNNAKNRTVVETYCEQVQAKMPESHIEIIPTSDLAMGLQVTKDAQEAGADLLVAAGGDGTLLSVVNAATGSETPITILPLGTSNDYAKMLGISSVEDAVTVTCEGVIDTVDAGLCTFLNEQGVQQQIYFCSSAGVGLFAHLFHLEQYAISQQLKRFLGDGAWPIMLLSSIAVCRPISTQVQLSGTNTTHEFTATMNMCELSKVPSAGGILLTPNAGSNTGYFDSWLVHDANKGQMFSVLIKALFNNAPHLKDKHVDYFAGQSDANRFGKSQVTQMTLTPEEPMMVHVNGDTVGQTPAMFELLPNALHVLKRAG